MKINIKILPALFIALFCLSGQIACSNNTYSNFNQYAAGKKRKLFIVNKLSAGHTSKAKILQFFGDPYNVFFRSEVEEVWTYRFDRKELQARIIKPAAPEEKIFDELILQFEGDKLEYYAFRHRNSKPR